MFDKIRYHIRVNNIYCQIDFPTSEKPTIKT